MTTACYTMLDVLCSLRGVLWTICEMVTLSYRLNCSVHTTYSTLLLNALKMSK